MAAGRYDFIIEQGAYLRRRITWKPGGLPADLTGFSARLRLRDSQNQIILTVTSTPSANGDVITILPAQSAVQLFISTLTTSGLNFDVGFYDLVVFDPASEGVRLLEGSVRFDFEGRN